MVSIIGSLIWAGIPYPLQLHSWLSRDYDPKRARDSKLFMVRNSNCLLDRPMAWRNDLQLYLPLKNPFPHIMYLDFLFHLVTFSLALGWMGKQFPTYTMSLLYTEFLCVYKGHKMMYFGWWITAKGCPVASKLVEENVLYNWSLCDFFFLCRIIFIQKSLSKVVEIEKT